MCIRDRDEEGEVLGMIQRKANASATTSYAVSVAYGNTLCTNGMSSADNDLNAIHIRKALPADEADIRTFLFMTCLLYTSNYATSKCTLTAMKSPKACESIRRCTFRKVLRPFTVSMMKTWQTVLRSSK